MSLRGKAIFASMKKLLFLGACLVALASHPVMAQTGGADVVAVKMLEYAGEQRITATHSNKKTDEVSSKTGRTNLPEAGVTLQKVFTTLHQQGYMIKGSTPTYAGSIGTFILVK
jgi:hypothetical protein